MGHGAGTVRNSHHAVQLSFQHATGWVTGSISGEKKPVRLCWLPTERRGRHYAVSGSIVVVGADTGAITILDLSAMVAML
jgi:hypothetical protein